MFNVVMDYLPEDEEVAVVTRNTAGAPAQIEPLFTGEDVLRFHDIVRKVPIAEEIVRYAVKLAAASRPHQDGAPDFINEWASWGAGTRAGQFLVLGAKTRALLKGRAHVTVDDIQTAYPTPAPRILLNYRAEAEGVNVEAIVKRLFLIR
jgi:MoxR-like ATPase